MKVENLIIIMLLIIIYLIMSKCGCKSMFSNRKENFPDSVPEYGFAN